MLQHVKVGHIALSQNGHFYFWAKKGPPDLFTTLLPDRQIHQIHQHTGEGDVLIINKSTKHT
jgi:hypothetical protein